MHQKGVTPGAYNGHTLSTALTARDVAETREYESADYRFRIADWESAVHVLDAEDQREVRPLSRAPRSQHSAFGVVEHPFLSAASRRCLLKSQVPWLRSSPWSVSSRIRARNIDRRLERTRRPRWTSQ
jgi:hypothetical protein